MAEYVVESYDVIPPGLYEVEMKSIVEKAAFFTNEDSGDEERRKYFQWAFEVVNDEEYAGRKLTANVSDKFGPRSKQRQWVESMLGRGLETGERFNTESLIGGVYHATVHHVTKGDQTFAEITSLNKIRKSPSAKKSA
jgi:hypothetical protein